MNANQTLQEIDRLMTEWREGRAPAGATEQAILDLLPPERTGEAGHRRPSEEAIYQKPLG